ncbi:MAG: bile acid:sodium symporter family protein [Rhizobiaceae bacterium]|nr:bile acid:sodium symporter family protein [Rhizobiaceae bacterium]MCV0406958.1 bile acid:sodium symporter family protein [Rhizobiaceae bacterium]
MGDIDDVVLNFSPASLTLLNVILCVVMFSIALDLRPDDFREVARRPKSFLAGFVSQFVALPALTFLLIVAMEPRPSIALGLMLVAACPGGNISNFLTHRAKGNVALSVSMTAVATLICPIATPLNIAIWGSLYGPTREILRATQIDPLSVLYTVTLLLILPMALGMTLNARRPDLAAKVRRPLRIVSMLIFVGFIVAALAANWAFFLAYVGQVAGLVVSHNALALAAGFTIATLLRTGEADRRTITIETGIQNSGLGLILIFAFFGGLGGMTVAAAFWGIWHAVSGLALASWMGRREPVPA